VSKNVRVAVASVDFEPALRGREPAIDHGAHCEPALPEPEREWLLIASIAGVALDANCHAFDTPHFA
jgi:hypothetical protein